MYKTGKFRRGDTTPGAKVRRTGGRWRIVYENFLLAIFAFLLASVAVLFIVVSLKIESSPVYKFVSELRGAAVEHSEKDLNPVVFDEGTDLFIEVRNEGSGYVYQGDQDVVLMRMNITPRKASRLMGLEFRASARSFKSLQLYVDDKYVASAPVYDGKAVFQDLWLKMDVGSENAVVVKGEITKTASSGDDISISIANTDDIVITGDLAKKFSMNVDFPMRGRELRVIGNKM